jgi:exopolyphosphatase/pppGpp-phosphohydrolase
MEKVWKTSARTGRCWTAAHAHPLKAGLHGTQRAVAGAYSVRKSGNNGIGQAQRQ